jgi:DNA-binding transcriptional ArsR family regulator
MLPDMVVGFGRRIDHHVRDQPSSTNWLTKSLVRSMLNHMVDNVVRLNRIFAALSDPTRRDLVARLAVGDATVGDLAAPYDVSMQAVSKHVKVLEEAGLVSRSRDAQRRPVHLEAEVFDLMTKWIERYRRQAEERFSRLDDVLKEMDDDDDGA